LVLEIGETGTAQPSDCVGGISKFARDYICQCGDEFFHVAMVGRDASALNFQIVGTKRRPLDLGGGHNGAPPAISRQVILIKERLETLIAVTLGIATPAPVTP
jgi:hypothetical protein